MRNGIGTEFALYLTYRTSCLELIFPLFLFYCNIANKLKHKQHLLHIELRCNRNCEYLLSFEWVRIYIVLNLIIFEYLSSKDFSYRLK